MTQVQQKAPCNYDTFESHGNAPVMYYSKRMLQQFGLRWQSYGPGHVAAGNL